MINIYVTNGKIKCGWKLLPHENKGTKKPCCAVRQAMLNVEALIMKCEDVMPHQMKGIRDG
jgi:hypothetical protein